MDIQANNELVLDSYWFNIVENKTEQKFKERKKIVSLKEQQQVDNDWITISQSSNFLETAMDNEEVVKLYKFELDNYLKKIPD